MPDGTVARVGIPQIEELLAAYSLFSPAYFLSAASLKNITESVMSLAWTCFHTCPKGRSF